MSFLCEDTARASSALRQQRLITTVCIIADGAGRQTDERLQITPLIGVSWKCEMGGQREMGQIGLRFVVFIKYLIISVL